MLTIQTKGITHYSYKVEMEAKQQQNVIFRDGESYATRRLKTSATELWLQRSLLHEGIFRNVINKCVFMLCMHLSK